MKVNVKLRPLRKADKVDLAQLANNKKLWNNLRDYFSSPYQVSDAAAFISLKETENSPLTFGIEYQSKLAGIISLEPQTDVYRNSAELGYWVGEPFWGNGIATQAVKLITEYGFVQLGLHRIFAGVFEHN